MKVLVTGATGFIGNYVVKELLRRNITVVASATDDLKASDFDWFSRVTFVAHKIGEENDTNLFEKFRRPDLAIHLAWPGLSDFKNKDHLDIHLPLQKKFIKKLILDGLCDITITGTCLEYGMKEGELREDMEPAPTINYPIAKNELHRALLELQKEIPFSLKWVRLFYMYGKGQSPKSILSQLDKALDEGLPAFNMSKGDQLRDYLPVESVAENIVIFALQQKIEGTINCCSGEPISVKQLVLNHLKQKNKTIVLNTGHYPYPDYEPFKFWGNNEKQKKIKNS